MSSTVSRTHGVRSFSFLTRGCSFATRHSRRKELPHEKAICLVTKPSEFQKELVAELGERAEDVRNRLVEPREDNMLKITSDGRKLALDQRLAYPELPDDPESKVNACVGNVLKVWRDTEPQKGAQLVFCDLSTPHGDGSFNVYDDIKQKLMAQGVPPEQIAFIHDAKTDVQKAELFSKVRKGQVRVLLSQYILSKEPGIRGYSAQNIWRMKQFFETYQDKPELSTLLRANTWSNNLHIMSKTKTDEERAFYLKLASKEKYKARELERQIDSGYYERLLLSDGKAPSGIDHTENTGMIRDLYMLEFLNLPEPYKEFDLKQAILKNMKQFLLEFGRDFIFMGEEYHLQVGKNDYFVDLLFYHRELQCLVAIDLKIDDFKPEYLGKMEFYLEALDRDIRKPHENPSVGIILCKSKDEDVVEYALSRNMSSTMISEYRTKLISKEILQKKLEELYDAADESQNSQQC